MTQGPAEPAAYAAPLVTCHNCDRPVPDGEFCGACGAYLLESGQSASGRHHAYAAHPGEHLFYPGLVSTLFPHLPQRRSGPFRIAVFAVAGLLLVLGFLRLTGPAVAAATAAVPFFYLFYLWEVEVYEDEPLRVIGLTFGVGMLLGIPWALLTGPYVSQTLILNLGGSVNPIRMVNAVVVLPLLAQALMLVGPVILYSTSRFDEALDGLSFGVAAALGFSLTTNLIELWPALHEGVLLIGTPGATALQILQRGALVPSAAASLTGLVAGAIWLHRGRRRAAVHHSWTASLPAAVLVAIIVQIGLGAVDMYSPSIVLSFVIYLIVDLLLLLCVRIALHHMLLAEAVEVPIGPDMACSHCGRIVPRMAFCPNCGIATRATPKAGAGRLGRAVR